MMETLRLLLSSQLKRSKLTKKTGGFTLIELLIAMVLAALVITPLMGFMLNIMDTDRREQAKATSEQEIQSALDYIAQDLQQSVYIYDANGIAAIKNQLPGSAATDKVPVLVFWKRSLLPKDRQVTLIDNTQAQVRCLVKFTGTTTCDERDYFVYSLVTYYLIKDNDSTWSSAARVGRFEIQDGIRDPNNYNNYLTKKDPGFKLFDLSLAGTIKDKMNAWTKDTPAYTADIVPLVDYIDQSTGSGVPALVNCTTTTSSNAQQVPATSTTANPTGIYSFYACVDSSRNLAQVYLRGNALARIQNNTTYSANKSNYFPSASIQVQGRGLLGFD